MRRILVGTGSASTSRTNYPRGTRFTARGHFCVQKMAKTAVQAGGTERATTVSVARSVFVEDAAVLLGVSRRTVYYRIREGKLRTVRTPGGSQRVLVESIEALLREARARARARGAGVSGTDPCERCPAT